MRWLWLALKGFVIISAALVFAVLFIVIAGALQQQPKIAAVPDNAVLELKIGGSLVETASRLDPADYFANPFIGDVPRETLVRDVVLAIRRAAEDDRITGMVVRLDSFVGGGTAALHWVADEIAAFRATGKPVLAYGRYFTQAQYLLAAQADQVWMNAAGSLILTGYGTYPLFYAEALEQIKATPHIFRVGEFKSAIEPFTRNSMSDEAREANADLLNALWTQYLDAVADARGLDRDRLRGFAQNPADALERFGGDNAQAVLELGLIDRIVGIDAWRAEAGTVFESARTTRGFRTVSLSDYVQNAKAAQGRPSGDQVAVVTSRGTIVPGEGGPQVTASEDFIKLLRAARRNNDVKAVVLRVDSPGGAIFAAELIRQEVAALRAAGKPVVASYGSVAASGGVYISTNADRIFAHPSSITGSIGVFGAFVTFEDSLNEIGVHSDGVGTTPLAAGINPLRPLSAEAKAWLQATVRDNYQDFLQVVADGRGRSVEEIDQVARGRVWSGVRAQELGLVDALGGLDEAIAAAADLAGLERYDIRYVEKAPGPYEKLVMQLMADAQAHGVWQPSPPKGPLGRLLGEVRNALDQVAMLQDPDHLYVLCETCDVRAR
ncbi:MAG: signal peptide peptidase SppA [Rhodothalassiaceae bacterium]